MKYVENNGLVVYRADRSFKIASKSEELLADDGIIGILAVFDSDILAELNDLETEFAATEELQKKIPVPESLLECSCMLEGCNFTVLKRVHHMFSCGFGLFCRILANVCFCSKRLKSLLWKSLLYSWPFRLSHLLSIHFNFPLFVPTHDTNKKQSFAVNNANNLITRDFQ